MLRGPTGYIETVGGHGIERATLSLKDNVPTGWGGRMYRRLKSWGQVGMVCGYAMRRM